MTLVLHRSQVRSVRLGATTSLEGGVLTVDADELGAELMAADERIESVTVRVALPGQSIRVVCCKDVIQPRCKPEGGEPGAGITHVLDSVAVVTCGPIVAFQEGIIDMTGPGARHTPFSELALVVLEAAVPSGTAPHSHEEALRTAGSIAAEYLAATCSAVEPDRSEEIRWDETPVDPALPRVAYVAMLLTQGLLHDNYVLGRYAADVVPCLLDPRVLIDSGVVSGNCVSACDKTTTYHHQNNPLVAELLAGHGTRWNFVGVVATNAPTRLAEKRRSASRAVELVRELDPAGAIVSKEGFGNPDADLMMIVADLESAGVRTVALTDEFAGSDGASQSLADGVPEADALVSVGNANERIVLPAMETVIGPLPDVARLAGGYPHSLRDDGTMEVELQAIVGSTNQLGFGRLSCRTV